MGHTSHLSPQADAERPSVTALTRSFSAAADRIMFCEMTARLGQIEERRMCRHMRRG